MRYGPVGVLSVVVCMAMPCSVRAEGMMSHPMPAMAAAPAQSMEDTRPVVDLKPETVALLRADMRSMLTAFANVLALIGEGKKDEAAAVLERELGMSAMASHPGMIAASRELPENVRMLGMEMHKAASKLARNLGALQPPAIDRGLGEVAAGCVSCHAAYRVR